MATIPADNPWEFVPEHLQVERHPPISAPKPETNDSPAAAAPVSPAPQVDTPETKQTNNVRQKPRKLIIVLLIATLTMFGVVAVLLVLNLTEESPKTPEVTVTLVEPKILDQDTAQKALLVQTDLVDEMFREISNTALPPKSGEHQTILKLGRYIIDAQTPFALEVKKGLPSTVPQNKAAFDDYRHLWQLGLTVLDIATKELEALASLAAAADDEAVKSHAESLKSWLIEWLLGKKGLYCELRNQFWKQVKTKRPSVGPNRKGQIAKLRKERRKFAEASDYPTDPMYEYCNSR